MRHVHNKAIKHPYGESTEKNRANVRRTTAQEWHLEATALVKAASAL